jgi:hypothetical protein
MENTTIQAHCHCGHASFTFPVPSSSLPLQSAFCSCSSCRHATGQLAASFAGIPIDKDDLDLNVSHLSKYDTSSQRSRYFCPRCGANVVDLADNRWRFCTGTLDGTQGLLERNVIFIGDTKDGGLAIWLSGIRKMFAAGPDSDEVDVGSLKQGLSTSRPTPNERLLGQCHCGGVRFQIRPQSDGAQYAAGLDTCASCRLTTGFEISSWFSVSLSQVQMSDTTPFDPTVGTLRCYSSSPGVFRHFCRTCGAAAFVTKDNQGWVDVAAGLLRAEEGARAGRWLEWTELGFLEEATDQILVDGLRKEFRKISKG